MIKSTVAPSRPTAMRTSAPPVPDPATAVESVRTWAAATPELARRLASGVPPAQVAMHRGVALLRENRTSDAVTSLAAAIALSPADPSLWTPIAVALDRSGRAGEAAWCLERSLALAPDQPDAWVLLGLVREKIDDPAGAEGAYREAVTRWPALRVGWQCLGLLLERRRDYAAAVAAFEASAALRGGDGADWANVGRLRYQQVALPEACDAYEAALRVDPANTHYRRMLEKARFVRRLLEGESETTLRFDGAARVPGQLFVLRGG